MDYVPDYTRTRKNSLPIQNRFTNTGIHNFASSRLQGLQGGGLLRMTTESSAMKSSLLESLLSEGETAERKRVRITADPFLTNQ